VMEGNRGLIYLRVMRTDSAVLYEPGYEFRFGQGFRLRQNHGEAAVIVSSGRAVHEALAAAAICAKRGVEVGVVDMPSVDEELLIKLSESGKLLVFVEQNNGYLWQNFLKTAYRFRDRRGAAGFDRVLAINTLDASGRPQFIHSATYEELTAAFGMTPKAIADSIENGLAERRQSDEPSHC
jgi:transketolase